MGNVIAWCHQQHTQRNGITSDEVYTLLSTLCSFHVKNDRGCLKEWTSTSWDTTRGRTHMFVGDKGVIYTLENSFLVGGRTLPSFRVHSHLWSNADSGSNLHPVLQLRCPQASPWRSTSVGATVASPSDPAAFSAGAHGASADTRLMKLHARLSVMMRSNHLWHHTCGADPASLLQSRCIFQQH